MPGRAIGETRQWNLPSRWLLRGRVPSIIPGEDAQCSVDSFSSEFMPSRPSVAIIGGGIGGLFAANALIAQGLRVAVYEQASALGEVGAGVFVTPNAVRHLERVGLGPAVKRWGARVGPGSCYFRHDGTPIAPVQVSDASGWNATFGMHRADFVDFLAANLPAGVVHTGHRAVGFEQNGDVARVEFSNGAAAM